MKTTVLLLKDKADGSAYRWALTRERFMGGTYAYVCRDHDGVDRVLSATNREGALGEVREIADRHALNLMA